MQDKTGNELHEGDYVKTYRRQIIGSVPSNIAIIGSIDYDTALVLFADDTVPIPFNSSPRTLLKLKEDVVSNNDRKRLSAARTVFDQMIKELKSA